MEKRNFKSNNPKNVQAHCPTCDGARACSSFGHVLGDWSFSDPDGNSMWGEDEHFLLQCKGCETVFYLLESWNIDDLDHWVDVNGETQTHINRRKVTYPKPESKIKPNWVGEIWKVDAQLFKILEEVYMVVENHAYILAAFGLRTALDRCTEVLKIDPAKTFDEKLKELLTGGWIGDTEYSVLGVVTDAGNAAAHRGWSPEQAEMEQLVMAMEAFLHRTFIVGQNALGIKANIPPKPKRKKAISTT